MKYAKKLNFSARKIVFLATILGLVGMAFLFTIDSATTSARSIEDAGDLPVASPSAQFPGTGFGPIPDLPSGTSCQTAQGTPLNITFNVTGITGSVSNVGLSVTGTHSWVGDITATLIAPNGATHNVFARTGATTATGSGDSTNLGGTYVFSDVAPAPPSGGWWQEATVQADAASMTPGTYRTTAAGGAGAPNPQPATVMNAAFGGVANANGTWTLRFTDGCNLDTGSISAATLTVDGAVVPVDANADFNGDGKTDFIVARATTTPLIEGAIDSGGPIRGNVISDLQETKKLRGRTGGESAVPQAPPIYWYSRANGAATTTIQQLGDAATDFIITEDFDGDGKDDITVWREAAATVAAFYIFQSGTNTTNVQLFGQTGDDPAVVGDYDGDNKADPAVFRCPDIAAPDGQCFFFYRGSNANPGGAVTYMPWGFGVDGDFFPLVGDFDGDGKNDFCIQRANPASPTNGQFVLLKSNGFGVEYINWGLSSDFLIPGDYDGDGKSDFCVRRTVSGARVHHILTRTGAVNQVTWGITGDSSVPGDYDGDGKTDIAVWRGNVNPDQNFFWILNSSNNSVSTFEWGQCATVSTCDFAVAGWAVH